jgi:subtilisin-like proprotein convertase family protein
MAMLVLLCSAPVLAYTPSHHKVLAEKQDMDTGIPGVSIWHDYGSFALYKVTDPAMALLSPDVCSRLVDAALLDTIQIDAIPFNPLQGDPDIPAQLRLEATSGYALQLIQFVGPVKQSWIDSVNAAGVRPVHYIASNAYVVWANADGRDALDTLVQAGDFLQYSGAWQPFYKLGSSIQRRILQNRNVDEVVTVTVQMLRHEGQKETEQFIAAQSIEQLVPWHEILEYQNSTITVRAADLASLAFRSDIYWIGEYFEREMFDEVQGQIMAASFDASQSGPDGTGYLDWLLSQGVSTNPEDYPVLTVVDDGIGNGTTASNDPTFHEFGALLNPTRLEFVDNCTNSSSGEGIGGHGHINASIAGGYDTRTGFPFEDSDGFQRGLGINPFARLAGTRIFDPGYDLSACGGTDTGTILSQQNSGALISTNSWGCAGCAGSYNDSSQAYDVGVRDADLSEPGNQPLIVFFSAGNSGPSSGTIGTPGNGKNMITVGASENDRATWTDGCNIGPSGADDAMDVISFSSRGPAPGGRIKPEVIAPGTHIQGTASTNNSYNGTSVCDQYQPNNQTVFAASSGTSHSTPAVAGVGSLYYHWLESQYGVTPSPAMMKSYMIAHPTYLTGVGANGTLPSNSQGYGMPDISVGLDDTPRFLFNQEVLLDNTGEEWTFQGGVADPTKPLRVVMSYTDAAGAIGTSPQVNNLNLEVSVNGTIYRGNEFSGQWSITGGSFDSQNNYEAVFLPAGTTGTLQVTVTAANIAGDGVPNTGDSTDQDFAIVVYNGSQDPDFTLTAAPDSIEVCAPADAVYTIDVGQILDYSDPVTLSVANAPAGSTTAFDVNPVTPVGSAHLTVTSAAVANGTYELQVVGNSTSGTHEASVSLTTADSVAGSFLLLSPSDGASELPLQPDFQWSAASLASSYAIDIATDESFTNIVDSVSGLTATSHTPALPLVQNSLYFWRVHADNACGRTTSAVRSFSTANIACIQFVSSDVPVPISSSGSPTVTSDVDVVGVDYITDVNVLDLFGNHTYMGDLDMNVLSPEGTQVQIMERDCGSLNDWDINFDDDGVGPAPAWPCPPTDAGTYQPSEPLAAFNEEDANGTWTLIINDNAGADGGALQGWTLEICGSSTPDCTVDEDCDNGLYCDGVETCGPGGGCVPGTPISCDDGVSCTADSCHEITDSCIHFPAGLLCNDGDVCNGTEVCDPILDCQPGTPLVCDDLIDCTIDSCSEAEQGCVFAPDDSVCQDGLFCNGAEVCDPESGCQIGSPVDIDDGIDCTIDFCDEDADQVVHDPDDAICDDGLFCTGVNECNVTLGCQEGVDPCPGDVCDDDTDICVACLVDNDCEDGNPCTTNTCVNNVCESTDNTGACDDGLLCTSDDVCSNGSCSGTIIPDCQKCESPSQCDDGNVCTADSCTGGICVYVNNEGPCDDGSVCTVDDTCSGGSCESGSPLNCDDIDACTADSCDDLSGCENVDTTPVGSCCDPQTGSLTTIDDGVDCTDDFCNSDGSVDHFDTCSGGQFCDAGLNACADPVSVLMTGDGLFHLLIELTGGGSRSYALHIVGDNENPEVDCMSGYVQSDGSIDAAAFSQSVLDWGASMVVTDIDIIPNATYELTLEGIDSPASIFATTWPWGDVDGNLANNLADAQLCVLGFQGEFPVPMEQMDLSPCGGNETINFADIQAAVLAFEGATYASSGCPIPCGE